MYRGQKNYRTYIEPRENPGGKMHSTRAGPVQAPSNLRAICRFDYQPDICKDYKETGYCGFGDSCKFMHDRGDYKSSWEIEKEWEAEQRTKRDILLNPTGSDAEDDEGEEYPTTCSLCQGPFVEPIVTKCGHFFCGTCAARRYRKTVKCFAWYVSPTAGSQQQC